MTVNEYMEKYTSVGSAECGRDMIFAVKTADSQSIGEYTVMLAEASDFSAKFVSDMKKKRYVTEGIHHIRKNASRKFSAVIDIISGDEASEFLLRTEIIAGTGSAVTADYVYFSAKSGRGERGKVTIDVVSDFGGGVGSAGEIYVDFYGCGKVSSYVRQEG